MSSRAELEAAYRVGNAPVQSYPFPHLFVRDVFPREYYAELLRLFPAPQFFKPLAEARGTQGYPERSILALSPESLGALPEPARAFWSELSRWFTGGSFGRLLIDKFASSLGERFKDAPAVEMFGEALLVEDRARYALGPHTDHPSKVLSMLFYLPPDESQAHLGTSIYVPKDPEFSCEGGAHHDFGLFERMITMPFLPNSLFAFVKTSRSFHGVEPVADHDASRHLLLYDIRLRELAPPPAGPVPSSERPSVKFSW